MGFWEIIHGLEKDIEELKKEESLAEQMGGKEKLQRQKTTKTQCKKE